MTTVRVALVTAPDAATADALARGLVEHKHAACVNVVPGLVSHYYWDGALQKDAELLLIVKTTEERLEGARKFVREHHPARLPEFVALPVSGGDAEYLAWVAK